MRIQKKDLVYIPILPVVTGFLMLLPSNLIEILKLHFRNPSPWSLFTSTFVHDNVSHYTSNMCLFILLILLQISIIPSAKHKKGYYYTLLLTVFTFPIISSLFQISLYPIFIPTLKTSCGSSGIVSALLGFSPTVILNYLSTQKGTNLTVSYGWYVAIAYIALIFTIVYYPYHKNLFLIYVPIVLLISTIYFYRKSIFEICREMIKITKEHPSMSFLVFVLIILFLTLPLFLFPIKMVERGRLTDFFVHYLGLIYGISISSFIFKTTNLRKITKNLKLVFL